jgi:hypothetical protein
MNAGFTTPSYYPPSPAPVASTNNLEQGKNNRTLFMVGGAVAVMLMAVLLAVLFTVWAVKHTGSAPDEVTVTAPPGERPAGVPVPPVPPMPPLPPPAPPAAGGHGEGHPAEVQRVDVPRYPGAEQVMEMVSTENGNVVQLQTGDSIGKVADWYKDRIGSTKNISLPGGVRVLRGQGLTVVITPGGENLTSILIKQGEER